MRTRETLPLFCRKCQFARERLLGGEMYCKQECKYNPQYRISAARSFYRRKSGSGMAA